MFFSWKKEDIAQLLHLDWDSSVRFIVHSHYLWKPLLGVESTPPLKRICIGSVKGPRPFQFRTALLVFDLGFGVGVGECSWATQIG